MKTTDFKVTEDLHASKGQRLANFFIDYIVQVLIGGVIGIVVGFIVNITDNIALYNWFFVDTSRWKDYLLGIIILIIYFTVIETLTAHSIGKYISKTKIVMEDGSKPKLSDILLRSICRLIPFEQFSFLGKDGRGWHDKQSETYVVDTARFDEKMKTFYELDQLGQEDKGAFSDFRIK